MIRRPRPPSCNLCVSWLALKKAREVLGHREKLRADEKSQGRRATNLLVPANARTLCTVKDILSLLAICVSALALCFSVLQFRANDQDRLERRTERLAT